MYRVLIPVDGDAGRAFHQARYVERLADGGGDLTATVLHVVPPDEFEQADEVAFTEIDAAVEAADLLENAGVTVHGTVGDGTASEEIRRAANDLDADELVMAGRKRSGVSRVLLGSTVRDVLLSAERPVTVTGPEVVFGDGMREVLLAVDRDVERARHQAEYVASLPNAPDGVNATVYYVFPHQDHKGAPPHEFSEIDAAVEAADLLETEDVPVERVADGGEVAGSILDAAGERDVDSIVMGGRKRSGIQRVLLGSITGDVVLSASRPVTITG
jgi:nucleotide-binding universal stress UspA family protein